MHSPPQDPDDDLRSPVSEASPATGSLRKKRNKTPSTPQTTATELMTPMNDTPMSTPFGSVSSNPCTAPVTAPSPRDEVADIALQDEEYFFDGSPSSHWDDEWNSRALFRDEEEPGKSSKRRNLARTDNLPPPIPPRDEFSSRDISGSSLNDGTSSRRKVRATRRTKSVTVGEHFSSSSSLGMSERRRSSSHSSRRSFSNFSMLDGDEVVKVDTTPLTTSDSSPDSSPSPTRDIPKHRRRLSSPIPADMEMLPLRARLAYKLGRMRTNKLVLVLCLVGVASLGITVSTNLSISIPTFQDDLVMDAEQLERAIAKYEETHDVRVRRPARLQPEGGLRGQLLLKHKGLPQKASSVGDKAIKKPIETYKKDKREEAGKKIIVSKEKYEKRHSKTTAETSAHQSDAKASSATPSSNHVSSAPKDSSFAAGSKRRFARPPEQDMRVSSSFEAIDENMFVAEEKGSGGSHAPRLVSLHDPITDKTVAQPRSITQYPADFTDNTQLYSILDSEDERLGRMEIRDPYSDEHCVPMQEWQTTFHPSCNGMHEVALEHMGGDSENDFHLFGTKGYWRNAWRIDMLGGHHHIEDRETAVLKTLKFEHNFEDAHFEHDRVDAVAMERLTASPHVINVFGFCGHSVVTEHADGSRVGELADKSKKTWLARLKIARDIANGLADVHGIDGDGNATFVHLDINPANVVSVGGTLKLNDFNIGIIRRWNTTSNTPCGFPAQYPNPQWRSPEEARNEQSLTEMVDVFSMGHIFFRLICGHEPWNKLEPGGKPSKEEIDRKVQQGMLPFIPPDILNTKDEEVAAIRSAMLRCYDKDPLKRPSAREIANVLQEALDKLTDGGTKKSS